MPGAFEPLVLEGFRRQYALARLFTRLRIGLDRPHKLNILARIAAAITPNSPPTSRSCRLADQQSWQQNFDRRLELSGGSNVGGKLLK